ncbi:CGNR zinc finger domain-containing protein [Bailinhaonella thermotolerans]|uniref:Zf-CGNR multi-domain protein n=1 Tax=Bailinhaonella thermotolerans TaxID=1070861 RepID=A0A3A4B8P3_9ACTN|nr:CGNR zinc finger domain-containing protein [Bailinhaonella thermotolerans]RJL30498.1 zf-CGNR multi-domain protein [Bailinhaonella thermotolerans]
MRTAKAVVLQGRDGQRFRFDPGALCMEFLLTGGEEGVLAQWEQLHAPGDLARWIERSGLGLPAPVLEEPGDLEDAKRLRAGVQRLADSAAGGLPLSYEPVLNEFAARPSLVPALTGTFESVWASPATCSQYLSEVARDAIALFSSPDRVRRVHRCGGDNCLLLFLDTSRPGTRRWCSMDRCGNRQKLRTRRRTAEPATSAAEAATSDAEVEPRGRNGRS